MPRAIPKNPQDTSGLLRCCGGCVSLKAVPAGNSGYCQPVCWGLLSPRGASRQRAEPHSLRSCLQLLDVSVCLSVCVSLCVCVCVCVCMCLCVSMCIFLRVYNCFL